MEFEFKNRKSLEDRKRMSYNLIFKNPDRIPLILEKDPTCKVVKIDKSNFLVERKSTVSKFLLEIKKLVKLPEEEAIFLSAKGKYSLSGTTLFEDIYSKYKDEDGFLYVSYTTELMFG